MSELGIGTFPTVWPGTRIISMRNPTIGFSAYLEEDTAIKARNEHNEVSAKIAILLTLHVTDPEHLYYQSMLIFSTLSHVQ